MSQVLEIDYIIAIVRSDGRAGVTCGAIDRRTLAAGIRNDANDAQ